MADSETFFGEGTPMARYIIFDGATTRQEHPTMNLRYLQRIKPQTESDDYRSYTPLAFVVAPCRVLQQEWAIITFDGQNRPIDRKTEWRDVPLVTE